MGFIVGVGGDDTHPPMSIRIFFCHKTLVFVLNNLSLYSMSIAEYCYSGEAIVMRYRKRR